MEVAALVNGGFNIFVFADNKRFKFKFSPFVSAPRKKKICVMTVKYDLVSIKTAALKTIPEFSKRCMFQTAKW